MLQTSKRGKFEFFYGKRRREGERGKFYFLASKHIEHALCNSSIDLMENPNYF